MTTPAAGIPIRTSFYKQNDYFDVCVINESKFALFSKKIESTKTLSIDMSDYNVVFLAPLKAKNTISIKAISVIALNNLNSRTGHIKIEASEKFVSLGSKIKAHLDILVSGDKGVFVHSVTKRRLELIREEFNDGILNEHGPTIVDALMDTVDAIEDPEGDSERIDIAEGFEFFNISSNS